MWAVTDYHTLSDHYIHVHTCRIDMYYREYLAEGAKNAINVDAQVADTVKQNVVTNPSRYAFDSAEVSCS